MQAVSVVLPFRNAAATLERAVRSILDQSHAELELILVDDASGDGGELLAEQLVAGDRRMRLIRLESHGGVAVAAETGRREARGEFIARMDADDFSHPQRLEKQLAFLRANPEIAGCGTAVQLLGAPLADPGRGFAEHVRWLNGLHSPGQVAAERFIDSPIANPSSLVRASALEAVGGHRDPEWAEDYDLWLRLLDAGYALCNLPETLLDWHDGPRRLTRSDQRYSAEQFSRAKAHYLSQLPAIAEHGVAIAGAGPIGKRLARHLVREEATVHSFFEVNPRRVGERIGGIQVRDHSLCQPEGPVLLGAVGLPGARKRVRTLALAVGFREGEDFYCVA